MVCIALAEPVMVTLRRSVREKQVSLFNAWRVSLLLTTTHPGEPDHTHWLWKPSSFHWTTSYTPNSGPTCFGFGFIFTSCSRQKVSELWHFSHSQQTTREFKSSSPALKLHVLWWFCHKIKPVSVPGLSLSVSTAGFSPATSFTSTAAGKINFTCFLSHLQED